MSDVCDASLTKSILCSILFPLFWKLCYIMMTLKYAILFPPEPNFINYLFI